MKKKITAQGPRDRKSFTITLPIEWVKQQNIDKTRLANLEIVNNKIIISAEKEAKEFRINADNFKDIIMKVLVWLYRFGASEIIITYSDKKTLRRIRETLDRKLIGFEIIEQKPNICVIRDISKESAEEFKTVMRRCFLLLLQLAEGYESEEEPEVQSMVKAIDKLTAFCQRILMRKGHSNFLKIPYYYQICAEIEHLGDYYVLLYEIKMKEKSNLKKINTMLRKVYNLLYNFDENKYNNTERALNELYKKIKNDFYKDKSNKIELYYLLDITHALKNILGNMFIIRFDN